MYASPLRSETAVCQLPVPDCKITLEAKAYDVTAPLRASACTLGGI